MPKIRTDRLLLRSFAEEDREIFIALSANEGFMRFSGGGALDREKAGATFDRILAPIRAGRPGQFAVIELESGRLIGYCGFFSQTVDEVEALEIAYRLHPDFWGRGLATEAARAVRDYAFRDLKCARVISLILPENEASKRVAIKNGMTLEKRTDFRGFPVLVFSVDRARWESRGHGA